jgi:hypothetical protein
MNEEALASFGPQLHWGGGMQMFIILTNRKLKKTFELQQSSYLSYCNNSFSFPDHLLSYRIRFTESMHSSRLKISLVIHAVIAECRKLKSKLSECRKGIIMIILEILKTGQMVQMKNSVRQGAPWRY